MDWVRMLNVRNDSQDAPALMYPLRLVGLPSPPPFGLFALSAYPCAGFNFVQFDSLSDDPEGRWYMVAPGQDSLPLPSLSRVGGF